MPLGPSLIRSVGEGSSAIYAVSKMVALRRLVRVEHECRHDPTPVYCPHRMNLVLACDALDLKHSKLALIGIN